MSYNLATFKRGASMKTILSIAVLTTALAPLAQAKVAKKMFVVYGVDNRVEVFEATELQQRLARSTMAVMDKNEMTRDPARPGVVQFTQSTLAEWINESSKSNKLFSEETKMAPGDINFCPGTRFVEQPNPSMCSGFLIAPDVAVTAGHCLDLPNFCEDFKWVVDFKVDPLTGKAGQDIPEENIYSCKKVVSGALDMMSAKDYALIQLDRRVDREPLTIRSESMVSDNQSLVVIGNPSGLPTKVAAGARVRKNEHEAFFVANLDTFQGNSGSAVFNAETGVVEGILVRGEEDFVPDFSKMCVKTNVCKEDDCRGEDVSRMTSIPEVAIQKTLEKAALNEDITTLAELMVQKTWLDFPNKVGTTVLMKAAQAGKAQSVQMLIDAGASVDAKDTQDNTALHLAAPELKAEVLDALVAGGVDLEARNAKGETALQIAANDLNLVTTKLLIQAGAEKNALDAKGDNILVPFLLSGNEKAVLELVSMGVDFKVIRNRASLRLKLKRLLRKVAKR